MSIDTFAAIVVAFNAFHLLVTIFGEKNTVIVRPTSNAD